MLHKLKSCKFVWHPAQTKPKQVEPALQAPLRFEPYDTHPSQHMKYHWQMKLFETFASMLKVQAIQMLKSPAMLYGQLVF